MWKLKFDTKLMDHQSEFVERFRMRKTMGLFDTPGTGKTLEILAAMCDRLETGDEAVVVVPPFLANTWATEVNHFTDIKLGKELHIVPYTMLKKKISSFKGFRFVAGDEAHALKNLDAQRTQTFHHYMNMDTPEFFIYATGTPVMNRIPEIYSFLLLLASYEHVSPKITTLYNSYYKFCSRFTNVTEKRIGGRSIMQFTGMKNIDELKEYLKPWTIRRTADALLPEMRNQTIVANYKDDPDLAASWSQFTGDDAGKDIVAKKNSAIAKAHFTAEYVQTQLEADCGPIVIFSDHRDPVASITLALSEKWRVASIMGGDNMTARSSIVDQFQKGKLDVLVATVGAASTGLTLTAANLIIFNDIPWVPSSLEQARKRIHRISQERECRCVYIAGSKVDEQIIRSIRNKMKVITAVVDAHREN